MANHLRMDRISVLVVILSLHSSCLGLGDSRSTPPLGLYDTPYEEKCEAGKEIIFDFTKILVTQTTRLPPITDVITLPAEMSHIPVTTVLKTLTIIETQTLEPDTITPPPPPEACQTIQPIHTTFTSLELATTVTADPNIEIKPWKEIEWETVPPVTATVTITTTMSKDNLMISKILDITNTIVLPTVTLMTTISVTTTEMLPAQIITKRLGKTKTERASPVTERHAPVTMMQPPKVKIHRIDITQTHIPPAVSKMVMYTTTTYEQKPCGYYKDKIPTRAFTHGRGATQAINFGLPNLSSG